MDNLLLFFAIPVAVIILSAIFETIICCPIKIAGITFAIFLIVAFAAFDETFLIFVIVYTLLAYLAAWLVKLWCERERNIQSIQDLIDEANCGVSDDNSNNNCNSCWCNCNNRRFYK
ncbi:MAG: DUF2651 family protein [Clostridia bacterium]|nr:DUF2651 family protein [Clostridia bacterium]